MEDQRFNWYDKHALDEKKSRNFTSRWDNNDGEDLYDWECAPLLKQFARDVAVRHGMLQNYNFLGYKDAYSLKHDIFLQNGYAFQ